MSTVQYNFPSATVTATNPSVGTNNSTAPVSSTEIGFIDGTGKLQGVSATNALPVTAASLPLPSGAATAANQVLEIAELTAIDGKLPSTLGTKTAANSLAVTMASDQPGQKMDIEYALGQYVASNSTTTPLGVSANFTGAWVETTNYAAIQVGVYTDQNSSSLGFKIEFSVDAATVDHAHYYTYEASSNGTGYTFQPEFKYFRVNYTNDGVAQTYFTLYTAMKPVALFPSQYRVEQAVTGQSQALVTKGVIYGLTTGGGGGYVAVKVTPSGAMNTATTLDAGTNIIGKVGIDQTTNGTTNAVYVNNFPATQPISGTVAATQSGTWNIGTVDTITNPVAVTGTFWQATQPVSGTFWQATQPVSLTAVPATTGRAKVGQLYNDYTTTNVTTAAYVQLTASTAATVNQIEIFDSSGEALILAVGAATSEVDQLYIFPGGNGPVQLAIPASSRISVKAKTATASAGFLAINLYS